MKRVTSPGGWVTLVQNPRKQCSGLASGIFCSKRLRGFQSSAGEGQFPSRSLFFQAAKAEKEEEREDEEELQISG